MTEETLEGRRETYMYHIQEVLRIKICVMSLKLCLDVLRFYTERLHLKVDYIIIIIIVNQCIKHIFNW